MGNDNSTSKRPTKKSASDNIDYLKEFYGKDHWNKKRSTSKNTIIFTSPQYVNPYPRNYDSFMDYSGVALPYESRYSSPYIKDNFFESDTPAEIEFVIYSTADGSQSHSPSKEKHISPQHDWYQRSPQGTHTKMNKMEEIGSRIHKLHNLIEKQIDSAEHNHLPDMSLSTTPENKFISTNKSDYGMSTSEVRPDFNKLQNVCSDTSSSENEEVNKRLYKLHVIHGGADGGKKKKHLTDEKLSTDDSVSSDMLYNNKKTKHLSSSSGIEFTDSSVDSADLIRMRNKVFDVNGFDSDLSEDAGLGSDSKSKSDSESHTEKVDRALRRMNQSKHMLSSESKEILGLNSDSAKYFEKKNHKKNEKYH